MPHTEKENFPFQCHVTIDRALSIRIAIAQPDAVTVTHAILVVGQAFYEACSLRMSESPASRTAMVEQRKSFPQAVPSSI